MDEQHVNHRPTQSNVGLRNYYLTRGLVAGGWVAAAFTIGRANAILAGALLVAYPAWDAAANLFDGARSGGLGRNRSQAVNAVVSGLAAVAILIALNDTAKVVEIFGAWAIVAGLLQLATGLRRWKRFGAQWAMVLSGAQSALAGAFFISRASMLVIPAISDIAGYAGVGAVYFLISAVLLTVREMRRRSA